MTPMTPMTPLPPPMTTSCAEAEALIDRVHAGEADDIDRERLLDHLDRCDPCGELHELLGRLAGEGLSAEPSDRELTALRQRVLTTLTQTGVVAAPRFSAASKTTRPTGRRRLVGSRWRWALAAAAAVACVASGMWIGSRYAPVASPGPDLAHGPTELDPLTTSLRAAAVRHTTFEQVTESPFVFSNVRAERAANGQIRLAFDVARHLDLMVDQGDPLLTEVLTQTLVEPSSLGTRLAAIELAAGDQVAPKIEEALIIAMTRDESLAVRLRAQETLAGLAAGPASAARPAVTEAMLELLASEPNVQLRLAAVDFLARHHVASDQVAQAMARGGRALEPALLVRASTYLDGAAIGDDR